MGNRLTPTTSNQLAHGINHPIPLKGQVYNAVNTNPPEGHYISGVLVLTAGPDGKHGQCARAAH